MTSCPNELKAFPVSTTTRPVTHVAEVDVKRASTNPSAFPVDAAGNISKAVPIAMSIINPKIKIRAGVRNSFRVLISASLTVLEGTCETGPFGVFSPIF
jgi:hypothetical protein